MAGNVEQQRSRIVAISPDDGSAIPLRHPALAAALSWAVPGLGQIYQGRTAKGGLFLTTILSTFVLGMWLGGGKVVYASLPSERDAGGGRGIGVIFRGGGRAVRELIKRGQFGCQLCAGIVALPAVVQAARLSGPAREPLWMGGFMAPPLAPGQLVSRAYADRLLRSDPDIDQDDFFDRPPLKQFRRDQLAMWHRRLGKFFEIGTLYTMLAGLLNLLVIYDAWAGPLASSADEKKRRAEAQAEASSP